MHRKTIIPCGGVTVPGKTESGTRLVPLQISERNHGRDKVVLQIADLHKKLYRPVPKPFLDLLEIATYVCCADQASPRGGVDVDTFGGLWRRHFEFHIPVRVPELWNGARAQALLRDTLEFLSDDTFDFRFHPATPTQEERRYFQKQLLEEPGAEPEGVAMFSGGLDSLAGAVEEAVERKHRWMLVNHHPTDKVNNVHRTLREMLAKKAGEFRPIHLHVKINKDSRLNREYTQRTRSFLYMALGATVARMLGHRSIRFYENGVVSMNLPVCAQVVGSRATRTTHPRTLLNFEALLTEVAGEPFGVTNPYIWDTKADVVKKITRAGCGELIGRSISCAHTWIFSNKHPHCGVCSQCIDRRFGVMAGKAEEFDPASGYASDVFIGARPKDEDRIMVASYVERANVVGKLQDAEQLLATFPEVARVLPHLLEKPLAAAHRVLDLHKRHSAEVGGVVEDMLGRHSRAIRERTLSRDCLLRLVCDSGGGASAAAPAVASTKHQNEQAERLSLNSEKPNTYRLRKSFKNWILVFDGNTEILPDERAVRLVEWLLKNPPDEPIHATVLEARVDGEPAADWAPTDDGEQILAGGIGEGGAVLDELSGRKLRGPVGEILAIKLEELRATIQDERSPQGERDAAQAEIDELLSANAKKYLDAAGKSAERVRKAIKRLIDELKVVEKRRGEPNQVLRAFAKHLDEFVWLPSVGGKGRVGASGKAGCFTYERPTGVIWRD